MTTREIRNLVAKSSLKDWYTNKSLTFIDAFTSEEYPLYGIVQIHNFLSSNIQAWRSQSTIPNFAQGNIEILESLLRSVENIVIDFAQHNNANSPDYQWNRDIGRIKPLTVININSEKTEFLLKLNATNPNIVQGAFNYFTNHYRINSKNDFDGFIHAYEFEHQEHSPIYNKRKIQFETTKSLHSKIIAYQKEIEEQLTKHLSKANEQSAQHSEEIDKLYKSKKDLVEKWFEQVEAEKHKTMADAKARISELENTYTELLRLKKPADYWKKRAEKLKAEGWRAVHWLIGLVCIGVVALYSLLWLTPEGMLLSFIQGKEQAIKWSVVYITFLSFLAYGIRALNKIAFSSFHLARDAEEREQLTYFYLSLIDDSAVDEKDKSLIMQSLFSRAETGLLKDESGPTMPSEMTSKIFNSK